MTQEYNRDVCLLCSVADECLRLRTVVDCMHCSESLTCAGTPVFNTPKCEARAREWHTAPPMSTLCMLAWQLLEHHDDFIPVEPISIDDGDKSMMVRCPRCNNITGGFARNYDLHVESVFHAKQQIMNQEYRIWCNFCGLDLKRVIS